MGYGLRDTGNGAKDNQVLFMETTPVFDLSDRNEISGVKIRSAQPSLVVRDSLAKPADALPELLRSCCWGWLQFDQFLNPRRSAFVSWKSNRFQFNVIGMGRTLLTT